MIPRGFDCCDARPRPLLIAAGGNPARITRTTSRPASLHGTLRPCWGHDSPANAVQFYPLASSWHRPSAVWTDPACRMACTVARGLPSARERTSHAIAGSELAWAL